jgi:hypothetical protein
MGPPLILLSNLPAGVPFLILRINRLVEIRRLPALLGRLTPRKLY